MYFDSHIHTLPFSADGHQTMEEVLERQKELPYGLITTEHIDYDANNEFVFEFDPDEYFKERSSLRSDTYLIGVEVGLQLKCLEKNKKLISSYPFDQVIGSIHVVEDMDLAFPPLYEKHSKNEAYRRYLNTMVENIMAFDDFDTLAHVDYVCRYAVYPDNELYVSDYLDTLTIIFNHIIEKDISLEINSRRLGDSKAVNSLNEIIRLYKSLGGKYVTIGSDAHRPAAISQHLDKAIEIAKNNDLSICYYKNRKRIICE